MNERRIRPLHVILEHSDQQAGESHSSTRQDSTYGVGRALFLFSAGVLSREGACVVYDTIRESAVESEIEEAKGDV